MGGGYDQMQMPQPPVSTEQRDAAAQQEALQASEASPRSKVRQEHDEQEFTLRRILDLTEGPAILRHEAHVIAGAFAEELADLRATGKGAARTLSRSEVVKRIEEWLGQKEALDNPTPGFEQEQED